ncbi:putative nuclease HARBI1 [Montipora capricornis]|uniref:putative nuclease HARBI1 n=1 Tax=Montipora capricornis TaxID=246305 RepID=UPI0035F165E2
MADLLFPIIRPQVRVRKFRQHEIYLDEFSYEELRSRYRFGGESIEFLTEILEKDLQRETKRNHALSPTLQILVALRFFASGSFLQIISDTFGLPKSSVSRVVKDVSLALAQKQNEFILWPSPAELQEVKRGFYDKGGFPGVIGCVDGTHVRIQAPRANENDFVNRKGFHSINVQAVCNHKVREHNVLSMIILCYNYLVSKASNFLIWEGGAHNFKDWKVV